MEGVMKINMGKISQILMIFTAYGGFGYFAIQAFIEYQAEMTGLNNFFTPVPDLPLPSITFCSQEIFKNVPDGTSKEMVLQNIKDYVFTMEDLFHQEFLKKEQIWNLRPIFSSKLGLCFSIRANQNINGTNYHSYWIRLPIGKLYQV